MNIRILLVDDHRIILDSVRAFLEDLEGFEIVGEATDGILAARLIRKFQPHVVIVDIGMPLVDGGQLTAWIQREHPQTKILVLSMHEEEAFVTAMFKAGAHGYLLKNCDCKELLLAIQTVFRGEVYLDSRLRQVAGGDREAYLPK